MSTPATLPSPVSLTADERRELARRKATCPFIGSLVVDGRLPVHQSRENPLAAVEDVKRLGNEGGGDLGKLLAMFARGNHAFMRDANGALRAAVPDGYFSLDFPDAQGSHPGDSGILMGAPPRRGAFDYSETEFARLAARARDGLLTRTAVGDYIAENVRRDPNARVVGGDVVVRMGHDLFELLEAAVPAAIKQVIGGAEDAREEQRVATQRLTKLLAEDNVAGSSGEFGLLFTLLSGIAGSAAASDEPVVRLDQVRTMFAELRLPPGWEPLRKTRLAWAKHTFAIVVSAYKSLDRLKDAARK